MMKNKIFFLLILLIGVGVVMGKTALTIPRGKLVFGNAQKLNEMTLPACQTKQLYSNNFSMFTKISKVDNNWFLFLQDGPEALGVKMFDLGNKSIRVILKKGFSPYYNAEHKTIFFNHVPSYEEGPYLYVGSLSDSTVTNIKKIIKGSSDANEIGVIPVSKDEVVFNYQNSSEHIFSYNMVTNELKTLSIKNCDYPKIWRSATKQLMCYNPKSEQYFLTDLSGGNTEAVEIKPNFIPVLYLPQNDQLLYTTIGFEFSPMLDPEHGRLGIYDFASGQSQILCDNVKLGTGDAAYYPSVD